MKNFEKYEKEILAVSPSLAFGIENNKIKSCFHLKCNQCFFSSYHNNDYESCGTRRGYWLYQEYKERPKLNRAEKSFCEAVSGGYIARDENGALHLYEQRPKKIREGWYSVGYYTSITTIRTLNPKISFDFVKWSDDEPWSVLDLLGLEVEDE